MTNLLIVLALVFGALFLILPLIEKTAKPVTPEQMQKLQRVFPVLLLIFAIAASVKFCTSS